MTETSPPPFDLTDRELDVLRRIVNGMTNDEIADDLYLSINSVKTYIRTCYRKIDVTTRAEAVVWGARNGLLRDYPPGTSAESDRPDEIA